MSEEKKELPNLTELIEDLTKNEYLFSIVTYKPGITWTLRDKDLKLIKANQNGKFCKNIEELIVCFLDAKKEYEEKMR